MDAIDPIVLEVGLEVVKAIVGVVIPALTIALTFYTKRLNDKFKRKSVVDEIHRLTRLAQETQTFKSMNIGEQTNTLLDSMRTYVLANDIPMSDSELEFLVERTLRSENSLKMRFALLDKTRSEK